MITKSKADLLIIGMGAAAQMAALYAYDANPSLKIVIVTKAVRGKGGSTRMVRGGLNVALGDADSRERHFKDTIKGGQYINDQELVKILVEEAPPTVMELESKFGCFFDRDSDGRIFQKANADGSKDHKVFKGEWTGLEIISRLTEQVIKRGIPVWEECRAVELLLDRTGESVTGALLFDIRSGGWLAVEASATLVATGGGPTQYKFHAAGADKTMDGLGVMYRAGVQMRDMEMIQFHPAALIVPGSVVTGAVFEKGLRAEGAYLYNGVGERFMLRYAPDSGEGAGRDVLCRSSYLEITSGRACPEGGIQMDATHLGVGWVWQNYSAMAKRFLQFGYDVARDRVPLAPSAQLFMGGAVVDSSCRSSLERLFVAGEDASGIHGANRHGGNGIAAACVFGRQAGKSIAEYLSNEHRTPEETSPGQIKETAHLLSQPFHHLSGGCPFELCRELQILNWNKVGVVREQSELDKALAEIDAMHEAAQNLKVTGAANYNHTFAAALDLRSMIDISRIVAASATLRQETRGAHARLEFAEQRDDHGLFNTYARRDENHQLKLETKAVEFKYRSLAECQHHQKKNKIKRGGTLNNAMSKGGSADGTTDAGRRS